MCKGVKNAMKERFSPVFNMETCYASFPIQYKNPPCRCVSAGIFFVAAVPMRQSAWFGNYGEQSGDGTATITHDEQQNQIVAFFFKIVD